jgi:hypothetical protein
MTPFDHVIFVQIRPEGLTLPDYERDIEEACRKLY